MRFRIPQNSINSIKIFSFFQIRNINNCKCTSSHDALDKIHLVSVKGNVVEPEVRGLGAGIYAIKVDKRSPDIYFLYAAKGTKCQKLLSNKRNMLNLKPWTKKSF